MTAVTFNWSCKHTWKKSAKNTAWCLLGCAIGDFGTILFFQLTQIPFPLLGIMILAVEQVGNYAVKIRFDDAHDTGIYSWKYLYNLGKKKLEIWDKYLEQLSLKGLSRGKTG